MERQSRSDLSSDLSGQIYWALAIAAFSACLMGFSLQSAGLACSAHVVLV